MFSKNSSYLPGVNTGLSSAVSASSTGAASVSGAASGAGVTTSRAANVAANAFFASARSLYPEVIGLLLSFVSNARHADPVRFSKILRKFFLI